MILSRSGAPLSAGLSEGPAYCRNAAFHLAAHPVRHGLRKRPAKSAAKYRQIWTPEGSPLVVHARKIAEGLNERMKASDLPVRVEYSMCYGNPSLDAQIRKIVRGDREALYPAAFPSVFSSDCRVCHGYRRQNLSDTAEHSGNENREAVL